MYVLLYYNLHSVCMLYMCDVLFIKNFMYTVASPVDTLNETLIKHVIESNQAFIKALEDYDLNSKMKKDESNKENKDSGDTGYIKPAKMVRFESSHPDISEFAHRILDSSPSEAKRARGDVSINKSSGKVRIMHLWIL